MPTEMLKLAILPSSALQVMNSSISGWSTRQDSHIGAASGPALSNHPERFVVGLQEANGAGGDAGGCRDFIAARAQAAEGKSIAAPCLLDEGRVTHGLEDAVWVFAHVVFDG